MQEFQRVQYQFSRYLRQPEQQPPPPAIEERRLAIYRDLIYNNIESFIRGAFPVLRSILTDDHWHKMVRDFVARHQSQSPYFLEISQEFLHYLMHERGLVEGDPGFMLELAHYEWTELALDVAPDIIPDRQQERLSILDACPQVSPLVWCLTYQYPVHKLGPGYQPDLPPGPPVFLVVYRNRQDEVKFLKTNAVTVKLLQLVQANGALTGRQALATVAEELLHPDPLQLENDGRLLLEQLLELDIIVDVFATSKD